MALSDETITFVLKARDEASAAMKAMASQFDDISRKAEESSNRVQASMDRMEQSFNRVGDSSRAMTDHLNRVNDSFDRTGRSAEDFGRKTDVSMKSVAEGAVVFNLVSNAVDGARARFDAMSGTLSHFSSVRQIATDFSILGAAVVASASVSALALATVPLALTALAVAAVATNADVKSAFTDMANHVKSGIQEMSQVMVPPVIGAIHSITAAFDGMKPQIQEVFNAAAGYVQPLTDGIIRLVQGIMPGFVAIMQQAGPVVFALRDGFAQLGQALGSFLTSLANVSTQAGVVLGQTFSLVSNLVVNLGTLAAAIIQVAAPLMQVLIPTLNSFITTVVNGVISALHALEPTFVSVAQAVSPLIGAIGQLIAQYLLPTLVDLFKTVGEIIRAVAPGFTQLVQAIGPLIPMVVNIIGPFKDFVIQVVNAALGLAQALVPALKLVLPVIADVANLVANFAGQILVSLANALKPIIPPLGDLARAIGVLLFNALNAVGPLVADLARIVLDLASTLLRALLPALTIFVDGLNGILKPIADAIQKFPILRDVILGIVIAIGIWKTATTAITVAQLALDAAMSLDPFYLIMEIIAALIIVLVGLELKFHFVEAAAKGLADFFTGPFVQGMRAIGDFFTGPFIQACQAVANFFTGPFMDAARTVGNFFSGPFIDFFRNSANVINQVMATMWHDIVNIFNALQTDMVNIGNSIWTNMKNVWNGLQADVVNIANSIWTNLKNIWNSIQTDVVNIANSLWNNLKNIWNSLQSDIVNIANSLWNNLKNIWNSLQTDLVNIANSLWNNLKNIWNSLQTDVVNIANSLWTNLRNIWNSLQTDVVNISNSLWNNVKNIFTGIWNDIRALATNLWTDLRNIWNSIQTDVINVANSLLNNLVSWATNVWHSVSSGFNNMKNEMIQIFNDIKNLAFRDPINWVITNVINGGIDGILHAVDGAIGTHLAFQPIATFAEGGVIPGYSPGIDSVPALLSPGEGILVPEVVQMLGGERGVSALNSMAPRVGGGAPGLISPGDNGIQEASLGGIISNIWGDITGAVSSAVGGIENAIKTVTNWVRGKVADAAQLALDKLVYPAIDNLPWPGGVMKEVAHTGTHKVGGEIVNWLRGQDKKDNAAAIAFNASAGVKQWDPQILQALAMLGQSPTYLGNVEFRMNQESAGNPNAVNLWDSNAAAGTPSVGLMQVIGPTYAAYKGPDSPPYAYGVSEDPLSNIYAGLHYGLARYGGMGFLTQAGGYDSGGWLEPGFTMAHNWTGRREMILPPYMSEMLEHMHERFVDSRQGRGRGGHWRDRDRDRDWDNDHDWDDFPHHFPKLPMLPSTLQRFLAPNQMRPLTDAQMVMGDRSLMTALGLGGGGGRSPFAGLFLNTNFGATGMGNAYEQNAETWVRTAGNPMGNFVGPGARASAAFSGGLWGASPNIMSWQSRRPLGHGDHDWDDFQRRGGVYLDMRGSQIMSDHDMDILMRKLSNRLGQWGFPSAGVQIRR